MRASSVVSVVSVDTSCGLAEQCSVSGHGMRASSVVSVSVVSVDTARGLAVQCSVSGVSRHGRRASSAVQRHRRTTSGSNFPLVLTL